MVGVDAAGFAKIMLRRVGAKLVEAEIVFALHDLEISQGHRRRDGASARTHRTVTPPHINKTIWKIKRQFNSAAMACGFVYGHEVIFGCGAGD